MDRRRLLTVAVGAVVGAGLRWAALDLAGPAGADTALLVVNVAGSAVIGAVLAARSFGRLGGEAARDLLAAGLCGALTSWSALAVQLAQETRAGEWAGATAWLAAPLVLGIGAAAATFSLTVAAGRRTA
jgi:CrcB protein